MASGQHNTQVRNWAVQHWKKPGHTVHAAEFQVSSSLSLQTGTVMSEVQGSSPWNSSAGVSSADMFAQHRRGQKRRGGVICSQNLQKL